MTARERTKDPAFSDPAYVGNAERHAGRSYAFREDIELLVATARSSGEREIFEEILFLAGFIRRAQMVLSRVGPEAEEIAKLKSELTEAVGRIIALIEQLCRVEDPDVRAGFKVKFLERTPSGFANLRGLIDDLALLKSYELDQE